MKIHFYISIKKAENIKIDYLKKFLPSLQLFSMSFSKTNQKLLILYILKYKQVKIIFFNWSAYKKNSHIYII